ncbi:Zinc finger protein CRM3 [Frankliniella fusca]|uniref:Zinc finger protein CRM3 n=1 Tax=Frankliniella fusca TaxID=407009 RepID=A0AAE1HQM5_9NEOP|nr:Zinc finger protein CRM3 [Frankliniella fusca]
MDLRKTGNFKCAVCAKVCVGTDELGTHYRHMHEPTFSYNCGEENCTKSFRDKRSMIRHVTERHAKKHCPDANAATQNQPGDNNQPGANARDVQQVQHFEPGMDLDDDNNYVMANEEVDEEPIENIPIEEELKKLAVETLMDLRSTSSLTGKAVERFEKGCFNMLKQYSVKVQQSISKSLTDKGMSPDEIQEVLKDLNVASDPFEGLRTIDEQLLYLHEHYGLVIPQTKFLGTRLDHRLDCKTNSFIPTQVNETFQYVSVIDTLKLILSNKSIRSKIFKDRVSKDGVLRSYVDGSHFKDHPFLKCHDTVIHILMFYDELEITNYLGSKTIIHKLATFFYQILNLPPEISSLLSSIYLLALAHADDMKRDGVMDKVLALLVQEMKQLSSDEGVQFLLDGEIFILRATLVALTADNLAAHDVLGFISTSARHFCRWCMVSRPEIRANANAVGELRTIEAHREHVAAVANNPRLKTQYGVKRSCPLDAIPYFNCIDNNVFDIFHDLLEGVVKLDIKCVLREYASRNPPKFTFQDLNNKISSFSYGIPDSKNRPSPNFTKEMLLGSAKISQSGTQMWCLIRVLPFLLGDFVKEPDEFLELIFLLQDILQIVFAFEVRPEDLDRLDSLIFRHNELFQKLFIDEREEDRGNVEENEEDVDDVGEVVEEVTEEQGKMRKEYKVYVTNKVHQIVHLPEMMRKFGPAVRMWCAKFEGRMKIFRQHASICCNFRNPPRTMAAMFQLSNLKSIVTEKEEFSVDFQKQGTQTTVKNSGYCQLLRDIGLVDNQIIHFTNSATLNGEEYRPGLFVCLPGSSLIRPSFAMITDVVITNRALYLVTKPWSNRGLSPKYNAFRCTPQEFSQHIAVNVSTLVNFRCIAPWTVGCHDVYLCVKTL